MAPPLHYPPEQTAAPVQFVDPGQLFYNPPPPPPAPVYNFTSPTMSMRAPTPVSQPLERKRRPLTVDEALQFSPLASIIPFDASMIPSFSSEVSRPKSAFDSPDNKAAGVRQLESMESETKLSNGQGVKDSKMLSSLVSMLKERKNVPEYKFKLPAGVTAPTKGEGASTAASPATSLSPSLRLTPFAKTLLERSHLTYRYGVAQVPTSNPQVPRKASETPRPTSSHIPSPVQRSTQPPQIAIQQQASPARSPVNKSQAPPAASPSLQLQPEQTPATTSSTPSFQPHLKVPQSAQALIEQPNRPNSGERQVKTELHQPPRLTPAIHIPPVPAELQSTPPSSHHKRLVPAVHTPAVPPHHQLAALQQSPPPTESSYHSQKASSTSNQPMFEVRIPPVSKEHRQAVQPPTSSPKTISSQSSGFQIVIPGAPLSDPRESYKAYSTAIPVESKHNQYHDQQRSAADATLQDLQNVLNDVFEAEVESQASGLNSTTDGILASASGPEGELIVLSPSILVKLDSSIRKVIERRRFGAITVEQVLQLQSLCGRSLSCADNMQISLQSDWPNLEDSARNEETSTCEQVLKSARVLLRTMTSGNGNKQILGEELLQKCITLLNKVVDNLILPTVEARSTGTDSGAFELASKYKKQIGQLLFECNKLMQILLDVLSKEEISETAVNQVEYFVIRMLFVENAPSEKESVLGIAKFEGFRKLAMLVLVEIFTRYTEQRQSIINEVLSSLQKLPTARQQGRQFKLDNGKRLQLVTVLLVRLVQASGVNTSSKSTRAALKAEAAELDEDEEESGDEDELAGRQAKVEDTEDEDEDMDDDLISPRLVKTIRGLHESAAKSAWHIVSFLVSRASTASKTGEQPHRHLLDMFVEDLINVLGMPDWPGAELLLQFLVTKMKEFATSEKTSAPVKAMALETLGTLGTAILDITSETQHVARALENDGNPFSSKMIDQFDNHLQGQLTDFDVAKWKGPFRAVMNYLQKKSSEGQAASAQRFLLTKWSKFLLWGNKGTSTELDEKRLNGGARDLGVTLGRMVAESKWNDPNPPDIGDAQARLAYLVSILHVGFCQAFAHIVSMLLGAINSEQITVRTRGLKSVTQMLEKDPALLERYPQVMHLIMRCAGDSSSQVKDNALQLLGKCITLRPSVEKDVIQTIINAATDQTVGIRKRALKLLREAYQRETTSEKHQDWRRNVRSISANSIFRRASDEEESVVDLVRQIFEEIWLDPFRTIATRDAVNNSDSILLKEQVAFIIQIVCDNEDFAKSAQDLFKFALSEKGKNAESSRKVCKLLVAAAFEGIIDTSELPGAPQQHRILQALAVFARTQPKLFTAEHVELLKPYVSCLSNGDDLSLFRGVVIIFRCVLPTLPALQHETLKKVQNDLLQVVSRVPKSELDEVASCLWTICQVLKAPEKLVKIMISVLQNLRKISKLPIASDEATLTKIQRLIRIAGHFGKYCDFQPDLAAFKQHLPELKGDLVAGKIVSGLQPYTASQQPPQAKAVAWEAIGMICRSWPRTFNHEGIAKDIQKILQGDDQILQHIVLTSIRDFFTSQDQTHDTEANALIKDPLAQGKLGGSMTATDNDGAAALIAQAYLKHILKISLHTTQDIALTATEVTASISRQGLVHPKEVGPALFALVTSPDQRVVAVALQQLKNLHSQHETLFEREYIRSIHEAFVYQKDVVGDVAGFVGSSPPRAKLHHVFEVIKESKAKFVSKFLTNFCGRVDFELTKLDVSKTLPVHLEYARFLLENLPFFDFSRVEDINLVIACLEKAVAATGSVVAHAINTELFNVTVDSVLGQSNGGLNLANGIIDSINGNDALPSIELAPLGELKPEAAPKPEISPERLRQLTTASIVLTMMWEARSHLRRLYNLNSANQSKGRGRPAKDTTNRAPTRNGLVSGDKYLAAIASFVHDCYTEQASTDRCRRFAEFMAIDDELKVGKGDDDELDGELAVDDQVAYDGGKGTKRKASTPDSNTPKKKRGRPRKSESRNSSEDVEMWD